MNILVTGVAGFIGFHTAIRLLNNTRHKITGIDNMNDYYDVDLKKARLSKIPSKNFLFHQADISEKDKLNDIFIHGKFNIVINLAAQAGVRYSIKQPEEYIQSNIVGFLNILEMCRHHCIQHLVYASSSSVYGLNETLPLSASSGADHPKSLYAATKKSNELMAHSYAHLFDLPVSGLRFFTVYGPWGRPDMALFLFTKAILENRPIDVFNFGNLKRDFTYIDDVITAITDIALSSPPSKLHNNWSPLKPDPSISSDPYQILNVGNSNPIELNYFIECIENAAGKIAIKNYLPSQPGDVDSTYANIEPLKNLTGFSPNTSIETGIKEFVSWFRAFYRYQ
jgi:UDP-glucuronate 4-epimerase